MNLPVESRDWINHKPVVQEASARDREGTSSILKSVIAINLSTTPSMYNTNSMSKPDVLDALSIEASSTLHCSPLATPQAAGHRLSSGPGYCRWMERQLEVKGAFAANKLESYNLQPSYKAFRGSVLEARVFLPEF